SIDVSTGVYQAGDGATNVADVIVAYDSLGNIGKSSVHLGPPLSIQQPATVPPLGSITLAGIGGTQAGYQWSIDTANSGQPAIDAGTGLYTAGPNGNTDDTVLLTDSGSHTATATVH